MHVNSPIALSRDCACDVVTNSQRAKAFASAFTQSTKCVRGFTTLADGEHKCLGSHGRVAMTKLTGVFDFGWNAGQPLDQIFTDPSGMKRRATAHKNNTADVAKLGRRHVQAAQLCSAFVRIKTTAHRVADRVWLLKDFFEHVMGVIPFSDVLGGKFNLADRVLRAVSRERSDLELVSPCRDDIEVV